jgi:hypothetical protein
MTRKKFDGLVAGVGALIAFGVAVSAWFLAQRHAPAGPAWLPLVTATLLVAGISLWLLFRGRYAIACGLFAAASWDLWVVEWLASVPRTSTALALAVCSTTGALLAALLRR